jgi:hypothetical protein
MTRSTQHELTFSEQIDVRISDKEKMPMVYARDFAGVFRVRYNLARAAGRAFSGVVFSDVPVFAEIVGTPC